MNQAPVDRRIRQTGWLFHGLGLFATVLLFMAAVLLAYRPIVRQGERLRAELVSLEALTSRSDEITSTNRLLREELGRLESQLASMLQRIPEAPREADFLGQVSHMANEVGLDILDYRPGTIDEKEKYNTMQVRLSSRGDYRSICHFLYGLNQLPRLCRITQMDISTSPDVPTYRAEMHLAVYFAPPEKIATAH